MSPVTISRDKTDLSLLAHKRAQGPEDGAMLARISAATKRKLTITAAPFPQHAKQGSVRLWSLGRETLGKFSVGNPPRQASVTQNASGHSMKAHSLHLATPVRV